MLPANVSARTVALRVGLAELLIVLAGLIFVRKEVYLAGRFSSMFLPWQEYALLALIFCDGVLRGLAEIEGQGQYPGPFKERSLCYLLPIILFLFVSCAALCDKMNVACIQAEWWRDTGLAIFASGIFLSRWEQRTRPKELKLEKASFDLADECARVSNTAGGAVPEIQAQGPWKLLRYPDRSSILLEFVGISMALAAWVPLLTLPGLIVVFKWELADLEALRISQFGENYLSYTRNSWFLIPYIY